MVMVLHKYLDFNAIGCSPETDIKIPLLKAPPTELFEHGNIELVPAQKHQCFSGTERNSSSYQGES